MLICICIGRVYSSATLRDTCVCVRARARGNACTFRTCWPCIVPLGKAPPHHRGVLCSTMRTVAARVSLSAIYLHCSITVIRETESTVTGDSQYFMATPRGGESDVFVSPPPPPPLFYSLFFSRTRATTKLTHSLTPASRCPSAMTFRKVNLAVASSTAE